MPQCSVLFAFERMLLDVGLGAYRVTTTPLHSSNPVLVVQHKVSIVDTLNDMRPCTDSIVRILRESGTW